MSHTERAHALLSASGASRWMECTPSPRLEEEFKEESSSFAEEGTLAHEISELELSLYLGKVDKKTYNKRLNAFKKSKHFSDEMLEEIEKYTTYVKEEFNSAKKVNKDAVILLEHRIDLTDYIEGGFGTGDTLIICDGTLENIDLKYGKGIAVKSEKNKQLMLYGLGALREFDLMYDIKTVRLTIVQPRMDSITSWDISAEELRTWGETEVVEKAKKAFKGEGEQKPGEWCHFCKAKPKCRALYESALKMAEKDFGTKHLLSDEELLEAYELAPTLNKWANSLEDYLISNALEGKKWEGFKLVEGRSNRTWKDSEEVEEALKKRGYSEKQILNTKIKGIGEIEKLIGKKTFEVVMRDHIIKPRGKPTLVKESDKRPAYDRLKEAEEDFKEAEEDFKEAEEDFKD